MKIPGELLKGVFVFNNNHLTDVTFTGDVSVDPMYGLIQLENCLIGFNFEKQGLDQKIAGLFSGLDMPDVSPTDLSTLIFMLYSVIKNQHCIKIQFR